MSPYVLAGYAMHTLDGVDRYIPARVDGARLTPDEATMWHTTYRTAMGIPPGTWSFERERADETEAREAACFVSDAAVRTLRAGGPS